MKNHISILSVSYNSTYHLKRLLKNMIQKAENPQNIQFIIIDNTNGKDSKIKDLFSINSKIVIIPNKGFGMQRSISHASALDRGLKVIKTRYSLIIDPDTYIFKKNWDTFCLNKIKNDKVVVGAPYPKWKIGKVHDYPSVIFMFFKTKDIKNFNKNFYPFPSIFKQTYNFIFRKVSRIGFIANKSILNNYKWLRLIIYKLENIFGITSPDTGNYIIESFRYEQYKPINFNAIYSSDKILKKSKNLLELAQEYELYFYNSEVFMTHMYSSGVFHWKTKRSSDLKYWELLINKIENVNEN